jgi:prenylcysteine alpha-carboxyl methylesterase
MTLASYVMLLRLVLFALLTFPLMMPHIIEYFTSSRIVRNVRYGSYSRNFLDVYLPKATVTKRKLPVFIAVTGGAWTIGYKAWFSLVAKQMTHLHDCIVITPDYRNFPVANVTDMIEDIESSIEFVKAQIETFGGDPSDIHLVGQSAGAQLLFLLLLRKLQDNQTLLPSIKSLVSIGGPLDIPRIRFHLNQRGFSGFILSEISGGDLESISPYHALIASSHAAKMFPKVKLIHGQQDVTIPKSTAEDFFSLCKSRNIDCSIDIVSEMTHSSGIVEDPLKGSNDTALRIIEFCLQNTRNSNNSRKCFVVSEKKDWQEKIVKLSQIFMPF